jgi:hypothetical protein
MYSSPTKCFPAMKVLFIFVVLCAIVLPSIEIGFCVIVAFNVTVEVFLEHIPADKVLLISYLGFRNVRKGRVFVTGDSEGDDVCCSSHVDAELVVITQEEISQIAKPVRAPILSQRGNNGRE